MKKQTAKKNIPSKPAQTKSAAPQSRRNESGSVMQMGKGSGQIIAGCLAPHPPHLVYAENPPQNEPKAECGWEVLRWGYERLRKSLAKDDYDVLIVHSPHWRTNVGTHFVGVPHLQSLSVDPIFPNLFRYHYDIEFDVELAEMIHNEAKDAGLSVKMMRNPDFRVDYGTIVSGHMLDPEWKKPIISISSEGLSNYYNHHVMHTKMVALGEATRRAVEASGRSAVLVASHSLSHRHFTEESPLPEDMAREHIHHHGQYVWDMKLLEMMKRGESKELVDIIPDFTEHTQGETDAGGLIWMLSAMGYPTRAAEVHAYGTVIGTGNAVVEFRN